jgi:hypothetical protein
MKPGEILKDEETIVLGVEIFFREEWVKVPERSLVMNKKVWLAKLADPNAIFRYPKKDKNENI